MNYEEFKEQFLEAIHSSKLGLMGLTPTETLDLRTMARSFEAHVEPFDSRREGRFYVNAKISWRWDAALTARFLTCEEHVLSEMLGRDKADVDTEQPWIRIDVRLHIGVMPNAEAFVLPKPQAWSHWVLTVNELLGGPDRLVSGEVTNTGLFMSWRGQPEVTVMGNEQGQPVVWSINVSAFELVKLPRLWDNPEREPDDDPREQIEAMLGRLERALGVWRESVELLV